MRIFDIREARSNTASNTAPRHSRSIDELLAYATKPGWFFATFTKLEKVGINPQSTYDTPLGVYAYPIKLVRDEIANDTLPFAGDAPVINVLALAAEGSRVVFLRGDPAARFKTLNEHTAAYLADRFPLLGRDDAPLPRERVMELIWSKVYTYAAEHARDQSAGGIWWGFTRLAALLSRYMKQENDAKGFGPADVAQLCYTADQLDKQIKGAGQWTHLMHQIGVDAVVDEGQGIIHSNEPTQAVFFTTRAFRVIDRLQNPRAITERFFIEDVFGLQRFLKIAGKKLPTYTLNRIIRAILDNDTTTGFAINQNRTFRFSIDNQGGLLGDITPYVNTLSRFVSSSNWNKEKKTLFADDMAGEIDRKISGQRGYSPIAGATLAILQSAIGSKGASDLMRTRFASDKQNGEWIYTPEDISRFDEFKKTYGLAPNEGL